MLNAKEKRDIWLKDANAQQELLNGRVKEDIEKYRKGHCSLRITDENGNPLKGARVKVTQTGHDFKYGANIFMLDEFEDEKRNRLYRETFKKYFNLATVPFYWDGLEPEQGKPRYAKDSKKVYRRPAPDLCVEYCEENGILPKLHCLIYESFMPDWPPKTDMAAMERLYEERFRQISQRYAGRMYEFEVINEILCESGWKNQSVISEKRDILPWAFDLARKYFLNETLVFNEANRLEQLYTNDYRDACFMMLDAALLRGAEIDKIGIQHHSFTGAMATTDEEYENTVRRGNSMFNPKIILKALDLLSEFDLPLEITEITVPTFGDTAEAEELQADLLELIYTVFFSHKNMESVVYWNLPDGCAYNAAGRIWNENRCGGGLFHNDMTPKKSAERLYYLFNKKWHTDLELTTDENGYVDFRGFYGSYDVEVNGTVCEIELHKGESCKTEIII